MIRQRLSLLLLACIVVATTICIAVVVWKYTHHQYNGIDLAIYSQVTWNISQGNGFASSIQGANYFGDHVEPLLVLLAPIVALFRSPMVLLVLQVLALFSSTWLVLLLAKSYCKELPSFLVSLGYLFSPIVWNMALFEFHMLTFAIPLLLAAFLFFARKKLVLFLIFSLLTLFVREDASLAIFGLSIFAFVRKRSILWWLIPAVASVAAFAGSFAIIQAFRDEGYKFTAYYSWLGDGPSDMLRTLFTRPLYVLGGIVTFGNSIFVISIILLFLGLPLFGLIGLIPGILIFAQLILAHFNPELLIETHYLALLVPTLFYSAILGIKKISSSQAVIVRKAVSDYRFLTSGIFVLLIIYSFLFLGPFMSKQGDILPSSEQKQRMELLTRIPDTAPVAASYAALPQLALREHIYSLHYLALGKKQFSDTPYVPDVSPHYVVFDLADVTFYEFQCVNLGTEECSPESVDNNLRDFLSGYSFIDSAGSWLLLQQKNESDGMSVVDVLIRSSTTHTTVPTNPQPITILRSEEISPGEFFPKELIIEYVVGKNDTTPEHRPALAIQTSSRTFQIPVGWNLVPVYSTRENAAFVMRIPLQADENTERLSMVTRRGYATLNGFRTVIPEISESKQLGETIDLQVQK